MRTDFVFDALEQAFWARQPERNDALIHHLGWVSEYVFIRHIKRLTEARDSTLGGQSQRQLRQCPGRDHQRSLQDRTNPQTHTVGKREAVKLATMEWVAWFNHQRLRESIGYVPLVENEANHYRQLAEEQTRENELTQTTQPP